MKNIHAENHLFQGPRWHGPHQDPVESRKAVWPDVKIGADPAEVKRSRLMAQEKCGALQVPYMPAVFGAQNSDPHDQPHSRARKKGALEDFRSNSAKALSSPRL